MEMKTGAIVIDGVKIAECTHKSIFDNESEED